MSDTDFWDSGSQGMVHPLVAAVSLPDTFNNPFYYQPHALCVQAVAELQTFLKGLHGPVRAEIDSGKMFGVLIVEHEGQTGYLQAYSGQIAAWDESDSRDLGVRNGFVPAVVDYLQPQGHFKQAESHISAINRQMETLENSPERQRLQAQLAALRAEGEQQLERYRLLMRQSKARRDALRKSGDADEAALIRESQYQKAELRRLKKRLQDKLRGLQEQIESQQEHIQRLRLERKAESDRLQRWLFCQFQMLNAHGERRDLLHIFADYYQDEHTHTDTLLPPSGAGECCEPKLLQYAFAHQLRPVQMAMFWWGASPKDELRRHGDYYPACSGKCKPILRWMLQGLKVAPNPLERDVSQTLQILYDDPWLSVVCKPAGMLSVPGKSRRCSVLSLFRQRFPDATGPMMVHRLDMDTSGLMVVAKDKETYVDLQRQFKAHLVHKQYVALLEGTYNSSAPRRGKIDLPLCADPNDRPRQRVDRVNGKQAVTEYEFIDDNRVLLTPHTGRTHQLRVHCASEQGLNRPIKGDPLYGHRGKRLYLHAASLSFIHPHTGERMEWESPADFSES